MEALTATRGNNRFAKSFQALIAAGKPAKLALIAIARKIIIVANAVLRDNQPYRT